MPAVWDALRAGRSGLGPLTLFASPRHGRHRVGQVCADVDALAGGIAVGDLVGPVEEAVALAAVQRRDLPPAPQLRRGDIIFWKGHMGVMLDGERLLHANAFHMAVAIEPLTEAITRIEKIAGPVTAIKRL